MRVGLVPIGQSPRDDVIPEMLPMMGRKIEIVERGVLDGLSPVEMEALSPKLGDCVLVTRLRDGTQVKLDKTHITKLLQNCVGTLGNQVDIIGILCSDAFPDLKSEKIILQAGLVLSKAVESITIKGKLGVIVPSAEQIKDAKDRWSRIREQNEITAASPYSGNEEQLAEAAIVLKDCDIIVLDCIGYDVKCKKIVKEVTPRPILLPRTLLARAIMELTDD